MPGKEEERWRSKDEGALFKRWRRTPSTVEAPASTPAPATPTPQPSELLKFLAIVSYHFLLYLIIFSILFYYHFSFEKK